MSEKTYLGYETLDSRNGHDVKKLQSIKIRTHSKHENKRENGTEAVMDRLESKWLIGYGHLKNMAEIRLSLKI